MSYESQIFDYENNFGDYEIVTINAKMGGVDLDEFDVPGNIIVVGGDSASTAEKELIELFWGGNDEANCDFIGEIVGTEDNVPDDVNFNITHLFK